MEPLALLARLLRMRRQTAARPFTLLLTSELSLTSAMITRLCGSPDWSAFRSYIQSLSSYDRLLALDPLLHAKPYYIGYTSLAHLIAARYFSTILTTNVDSALEDALMEVGGSALAPQVLVLHRDPEAHITQMLLDPTREPRIIKLHGSLRDGILPAHFPDFFELSPAMCQSLEVYLNQDLIVVGSLLREHAIERLLSWESKGALYSITEREIEPEEAIYKLVRERGGNLAQRLLTSAPDRFFSQLERALLPHPSLPSTRATNLRDTYMPPPIHHTNEATDQGAIYETDQGAIYESIGEDDSMLHLFSGAFENADPFSPTLEYAWPQVSSPPSPAIDPRNSFISPELAPATEHAHVPPAISAETESTQHPTQKQVRADILLVTVTEVETEAVFGALQASFGRIYERRFIDDKTYYELGIINGAHVFLMQSEMGVGGPGGSILTVSEGISQLKPRAVIMVGIAFGFDAEKQRIGDILVSLRLRGYELQRYGTGVDGTSSLILRGDLTSASIRLVDRFRAGYKSWKRTARVAFGLLISGEKLVDNKEFRDQLRMREPEALGGEMEGIGLYAVAHRHKVDWILVKAICDWADGHKSEHQKRNQKRAARNAALFTMHVLQETIFYQ